MGNHEYCEDCGESSFHYGRPCNPEKAAKIHAEMVEMKKKREARVPVLRALASELRARGFEVSEERSQYHYDFWYLRIS